MTADPESGIVPDAGAGAQIGLQTIASIGEFALIERIRAVLEGPLNRPAAPGAPCDLRLGIGDDAAIIRPQPGWDLALTCDTQVCGRHFDPRWMGPRVIGRRAMMVSLSDIAAMGGEPRHALVSLGLPGSMEVAAVEELNRGFLDALEGTEAHIVGGNITGCGREWFVDITLVGRVEQGQALTRAGARPGDRILVTGSPGRSGAGLAILQAITRNGATSPVAPARHEIASSVAPPSDGAASDPAVVGPGAASFFPHAGYEEIEMFLTKNLWARSLVRAFQQPQARLAVGRRLIGMVGRPVTALMDLSDGLIGDLAHICEQSGVRARIDVTRLPRDLDLEAAACHFGRTRAAWTLGPGDDYELLLIVRPADSELVANELRAVTGLTITEIGEILPPGVGTGLVEVTGGPPGEHDGAGWDHFLANS